MSSVLTIEQWNPENIKYGVAKKTKLGKSINIISTQTNKFLELSTPRMRTWGISDFVDKDTGVHDGKFSLALCFPDSDFETDKTTAFLEKLKKFQDKIMNDACDHINDWWDNSEELDASYIKKSMFKFVKYPKNKETKKVDYTRAPSIQCKVQNYNGEWKTLIFDTNKNLLFPSTNPEYSGMTPADFVPKLSNVNCVIQCSGIWIGERAWGVSFVLKQCVVKPSENIINSKTCFVNIDDDDIKAINNQKLITTDDIEIDEETATVYKASIPVPVKKTTFIEDSDNEDVPHPLPPTIEEHTEPETKIEEQEPKIEEHKEPVVVTKRKVVKKKT